MFERNCPICNKILNYKTKRYYKIACDKNKLCIQCIGLNKIGWKHSPESIQKIKDARLKQIITEETKEKLRISHIGYHHTEETKNKIRNFRLGSVMSEKTKEKLRFISTGKKHSDETKHKISNGNKGKKISEETIKKMRSRKCSEETIQKIKNARHHQIFSKESRLKMSESAKNRDNKWRKNSSIAHAGKKLSSETKIKLRLLRINQIQKNILNGNQLFPNFNPEACIVIDNYGKQNGYNFQHAMNGGEYHIKELGYWVDGYDKEKNTIIEYYENHHENRKQKEKDLKRKLEIIKLLNCEFIELKENVLMKFIKEI